MTSKDTSPDAGQDGKDAVSVFRPPTQTAPVVFAAPHSGRDYSPEFVARAKLDPLSLRRSEDAFVDRMFETAPGHGAPMIRANFPRAYVDANREAYELDPRMFQDRLPDHVTTRSPRITAGLGTVPRVVANGEEIYGDKLTFLEAQQRIEATHRPYHDALSGLIRDTRHAFGGCLLIDCHSMPSNIGTDGAQAALPDIVLGDCHATSAAAYFTDSIEAALKRLDFCVVRNRPYAGGYTTRYYGRPRYGIHAVQIEINRALYLDEQRIEALPAIDGIIRRIDAFIADICAETRRRLLPQAAE